jgi:hypothetical protein
MASRWSNFRTRKHSDILSHQSGNDLNEQTKKGALPMSTYWPSGFVSLGNRFVTAVWPSVALKEWPLSFQAKHPSCHPTL